jgi:hypothetical protein
MTKKWVLKEINAIKQAVYDLISRVDARGSSMHKESADALALHEDLLLDVAYQQTLDEFDV